MFSEKGHFHLIDYNLLLFTKLYFSFQAELSLHDLGGISMLSHIFNFDQTLMSMTPAMHYHC